MKVLLVGSDGQLGRSILHRAGRASREIVDVGRSDLDLEQPASLAAVIDKVAPDVILNTAAYTNVDGAEDEPDRAFRINAAAAGALAQLAQGMNARIIHISTDYVFSGRQQRPYREDDETAPLGVYGRSKLAGEEAVRAGSANHLIIRTAWIYSPFGRNFVKTMMTMAESHDSITVVDDQCGNPSSGLHLADGLLTVLDDWRRGGDAGLGKTYHLAGSGAASWAELARETYRRCEEAGLPSCEVIPVATQDRAAKAQRPANSTLDCSLFERDFGYRMPEWRGGVAEVVGLISGGNMRA